LFSENELFHTKFYRNSKPKFYIQYLFIESLTIYEKMWKNVVKPGGTHMTIWRMRITYWLPQTTNTYSEYVIPIDFSTATIVTWTHFNVTF